MTTPTVLPQPTNAQDRRAEVSPKIRILTVVRFPLGGIRTYLKYTYTQLDPLKYRFTIAAVACHEPPLTSHDLAGLEVDRFESEEAHGNRGLLRTTREALRHSRVDLIHSQGLTSGLIALLAGWRARIPHVITHHDVFRHDQFQGAKGWLRRRLMTILMPRAHLIICVTEDARQNFLEYFPSFPAAKLRVVPNGIDTAPYAEIAARRRLRTADFRSPNTPFRFGFLGRFMPQKGLDILIRAVAELARQRYTPQSFRILALNRGDCIGRYKAQIAREGLEPFFEFLGFRTAVADLLGELDCMVMPSRWEAAGLVAMEALVAGCPVIASDCLGLREVLRDTPALVARAEDPQTLARQMKTAMDHEAELRPVFCGFASVAQERFDVRRTAELMKGIFTELLRSSPDE